MKLLDNLSMDKQQQRLQPFLKLGSYFTEPFRILVEEVLFLVREYGVSQFNLLTLSAPPSLDDRLKFAAHVHDGWKRAQHLISERLIANLELRNDYRKQIKQLHGQRKGEEKTKITAEILRLRLEIAVLRRLFDVMPWTMLQGEHSTIRRLQTPGGEHNLSAKNIRDAIPTADQFNKDPHTIALCNDISSFIHVGDLLVFDVKNQHRAFVELKSGSKNILFSRAAAHAVHMGDDALEEKFKSKLDPTDLAHYLRSRKQHERGSAITSTIKNEGGVDPNTGAKVSIHSSSIVVQTFSDKIVGCWTELSETKKWAICTVDQCVHIGVYNDQQSAFVGFNAWMDAIHCTSKVHNITDSFKDPMVRPFGSLNLPYELLLKILKGEVFIILCFDVRAFIDFGNQLFPGYLSIANPRESAEARRQPFYHLELDGRAVATSSPWGKGFLGGGIQDRVIFDLQRPENLISMNHEAIDSVEGDNALNDD
ncbi:MAG: hypothetical protein FD135_238 [Comamonadaceae bacterium]|nr:MAG: hypothetical protein FD135_238 [Comamonadaceae bacterium]